jgi:hypothetical protein
VEPVPVAVKDALEVEDGEALPLVSGVVLYHTATVAI